MTTLCLLSLQSYASEPEKNLNIAIEKFKQCTLKKDVKCLFDMTDKEYTKANGLSFDIFKEGFKAVDVQKITTQSVGMQKVIVAKVGFNVSTSVNGQKMPDGLQYYYANSYDYGKTWTFEPIPLDQAEMDYN